MLLFILPTREERGVERTGSALGLDVFLIEFHMIDDLLYQNLPLAHPLVCIQQLVRFNSLPHELLSVL